MASLGAPACSVSNAYMAKNKTLLTQQGMTEAQFARAQAKGAWGVAKGTEGFPTDKPFLTGTYTGGKYPKDYEFYKSKTPGKVLVKKKDPYFPSEDEIFDANFEAYLDSPNWDLQLPNSPAPVAGNSASVGAMSDEDVSALFVKTKDEIAKAKGINIKGVNKALDDEVFAAISKQIGYTPAEVKAKVDAYKASGKKLSALKKKTLPKKHPEPPAPKVHPSVAQEPVVPLPKPDPLPNGVPTVATQETVTDSVEYLQVHLPEYLDEDVAKAYIKAKDELAASPDNPWTLYTQGNPDFEAAIVNLMEKSYGIDLSPSQITKQLARYKADGNKISVLKKKMAKNGEYAPKADTLKAKKGDPTGKGKTTKTQAMKDIEEAAQAGYTPTSIFQFAAKDKDAIFLGLKHDLYAAMNPEAAYSKVEAFWKAKYPNGGPNMLDIVRVYDQRKAAELGIPNANFYEKKIVEYASSPAGKAKITAERTAKELEKNLPPLPADSSGYQDLSLGDAADMQAKAEPWKTDQRNGLREYTSGSYRDMNNYLRGVSGYLSDNLKLAANAAQRGMRPATQQFLTHRGCDFKQFGLNSYEDALKLVGKTVQDKGFLSTSAGGRAAFSGSVRLDVEIPTGTLGAYVKSISHFAHENEYLVAAGTRYEVLSVKKDGYQTVVRIRAIPGSQTKGSLT